MHTTSAQSVVVGFAGMTHLGIVSSASVAAKGFRTVCYDPAEPTSRGSWPATFR